MSSPADSRDNCAHLPKLVQPEPIESVHLQQPSEKSLLNWYASRYSASRSIADDLVTGIAYCEILDSIFPNLINTKSLVRFRPGRDDIVHNLRLLRFALSRLNITLPYDISALASRSSLTVMRMAYWFKVFIEVNQN
ncbi:MAG: Microtubule-associated protein RP/EB member 2 [Marteilia pararefringens]